MSKKKDARTHEEAMHGLAPGQRLEIIGSYIARRGRLWYRFKVSFAFSLVSMILAITIWYFFNFIFSYRGKFI